MEHFKVNSNNNPRLLLLLALTAEVLFVGFFPRHASCGVAMSTSIQLRAQVLPVQKLVQLREPGVIVISDTDVQKGIVKVSDLSVIEISNNSPDGCYLVVEVTGSIDYEWASVDLAGRSVMIPPFGGIIHWTGRGKTIVPVS